MTKKNILHGLMVCAIALLMAIQPVTAMTSKLSATQKSALENAVIFSIGGSPLLPIFTSSSIGITPTEGGDRYNITGMIYLSVEDRLSTKNITLDRIFITPTTTDPNHVIIQVQYLVRNYGSGSMDFVRHDISVDAMIPLYHNRTLNVSELHLTNATVTKLGYIVEGNEIIQSVQIAYGFSAIIMDRSTVANSINGYSVGFSLLFVLGGIVICILGIRSRKNRDPEILVK